MTQTAETMWVCQICGYEHRGTTPPECCPACGAPPLEFRSADSPRIAQSAETDAALYDVGSAEELGKKSLCEVEIPGGTVALVCRDGQFSALSGACNHAGGPLGRGRLEGDYVVCPWHQWRFHEKTGCGKPGCLCEGDNVPVYEVKVENGRVLINTSKATPRVRAPRHPHPLTHISRRGGEGGAAISDPLRVVGISTTNMDIQNPRYSSSDDLLQKALSHAQTLGAETRLIRLAAMKFRACEGYYSQSARACTWPCSITQMDPADEMAQIYEAFVQWGDVFLIATPIRWGQASSLYYKMVERMNCIQNQETIANKHLMRTKVVGLIITGGQDNIQSVAGQMMTFFGELGCQFPQFPFIAHSRGWSAEDMENNVHYVKESRDLHEAAEGLVERCLDTCRALLGVKIGESRLPRGGRKAHELDVHAQI